MAGGYLYVAYTTPDSYIHLTYATVGSGYALNPEPPIYFGNGAPIYGAASNPALGTDGTYLYLAWIDTNGILNYLRSQYAVNGPTVYWQNGATQLIANTGNQNFPLIYSPSIAVVPSADGSQQTLYISAIQQSTANGKDTRSLWLARQNVTTAGSFPTWTNFPQYSNIGMSPGLGVFNHTLYIAFPALDNSHSLYYYTTTDGVNLTLQTGASGDSSSTSPSLAVFNNYLYMAFRTNDGNHKFIWKYSSDGLNWSGNYPWNQTMGGPPTIVYGNNLQSDPGHLINIFVSDDQYQYLYAGETQ